jgi:hypothetical protein
MLPSRFPRRLNITHVMQSGKLNLPGKDSVAMLRPWKKVAADFSVRFQTDLPCFCTVSYW